MDFHLQVVIYSTMIISSMAQLPVSPLSGREVTGSMPVYTTKAPVLVRPTLGVGKEKLYPYSLHQNPHAYKTANEKSLDKNRETNKKISFYRT